MIAVVTDTTIEPTREGDEHVGSVLLMVDKPVFLALSAAVEVAFEDPASTPDEYAAAADELLTFFREQS